MNFVITMAGAGSRFKNAGYTEPKWKLEAHGKTMMEWALDSLPMNLCTMIIFVVQKQDMEAVKEIVKRRYPDLNAGFFAMSRLSRGQADTVLQTEYFLNKDQPILIYNIDTAFTSKKLEANLTSDVDGILGSFKSKEDRFSYAKVSKGKVTQVAEKEVISGDALTGLYYYKNTEEFINETREMIRSGEMVNGEFYIAPVFQRLVEKEKTIKLDKADKVWILGTPDEFEAFKAEAEPPSQ